MRRRALLATLGVGYTALSGCTALESAPSFAVDPDPRPEGMPVALDATLAFEGSDERPPTVDVSMTNDSGSKQDVTNSGPSDALPFFGGYAAGPDGNGIGSVDSLSGIRYDGCWKGSRTTVGGNAAHAHRTLSPGETMEKALYLFNRESSDCWPAGEYYFAEGWGIGETPLEMDYPEEQGYGWGFTVTIS
jgi:hypothetical protein